MNVQPLNHSASVASKHTISVMVENRPGVLARVAGLFARRGFNINSLAVSATENPDISRMTIVTHGDEAHLMQVIKQLNKLIDVITIYDHTGEDLVEREIALIKVRANVANRMEIMQLAAVFHAEIVTILPSDEVMIVEITGEEARIDAFLETLAKFEILEFVRTGKIALVRGARQT
ncbi:MAG TPA: acetolactate synthase small subunit [bacterium]|nr:acetolactate synthase small subunit [bacterium]